MQDYEGMMKLYEELYLSCGLISTFFLVLAFAFFIGFRIPRIYRELSGKQARKTIREMREKQTEVCEKRTGLCENREGTSQKLGTNHEQLASMHARQEMNHEQLLSMHARQELKMNHEQLLGTSEEQGESSKRQDETILLGEGADFYIIRSIVEVHAEEIVVP